MLLFVVCFFGSLLLQLVSLHVDRVLVCGCYCDLLLFSGACGCSLFGVVHCCMLLVGVWCCVLVCRWCAVLSVVVACCCSLLFESLSSL